MWQLTKRLCLSPWLLLATINTTPTRAFLSSSPSVVVSHSTTSTSRLPLSSSSRLEGNQREPTAEELAIMDEMIDKLASAEPYELPAAVQRAFRVVSSPPFFLRLAARADADTAHPERWTTLAANVVATVEAVRATAQERMDDTAATLERIVKAAAEPGSGEFLVPLSAERIDALREAMEGDDEGEEDSDILVDHPPEAFLGTLDAWMNKAHQDGMDGMVEILQKVLQMYAGKHIVQTTKDASALWSQLLETDAQAWDDVLQQAGGEEKEELIKEIQRYLETIVLSMESGSMLQRVEAEYLKELLTRAEAAQK